VLAPNVSFFASGCNELVSCPFSVAADDSAPHNRGCALPGTGPGEGWPRPGWGFAVEAAALGMTWRLGLAVAEVRWVPGSAVRVLVDGRRVLTQIWAIRWAAGRDHAAPSRFRSPSSRVRRGWPTSRTCCAPPQFRHVDGRGPSSSWHMGSSTFCRSSRCEQARARRQAASSARSRQQPPSLRTAAAPATRAVGPPALCPAGSRV